MFQILVPAGVPPDACLILLGALPSRLAAGGRASSKSSAGNVRSSGMRGSTGRQGTWPRSIACSTRRHCEIFHAGRSMIRFTVRRPILSSWAIGRWLRPARYHARCLLGGWRLYQCGWYVAFHQRPGLALSHALYGGPVLGPDEVASSSKEANQRQGRPGADQGADWAVPEAAAGSRLWVEAWNGLAPFDASAEPAVRMARVLRSYDVAVSCLSAAGPYRQPVPDGPSRRPFAYLDRLYARRFDAPLRAS